MRTMKVRALGLVVAIAAAVMAGGQSAQAADDFDIQAGAAHPTQPAKAYEYTRFYPSLLRVHRGQTVTWSIAAVSTTAVGFHTVTFMPSDGPPRPGFLRADEIPGYNNLEEKWWQPSACGHADQAACVLSDTKTYLSSGIPR
jgi:hypothetical protein